jgi:hypothetical protein
MRVDRRVSDTSYRAQRPDLAGKATARPPVGCRASGRLGFPASRRCVHPPRLARGRGFVYRGNPELRTAVGSTGSGQGFVAFGRSEVRNAMSRSPPSRGRVHFSVCSVPEVRSAWTFAPNGSLSSPPNSPRSKARKTVGSERRRTGRGTDPRPVLHACPRPGTPALPSITTTDPGLFAFARGMSGRARRLFGTPPAVRWACSPITPWKQAPVTETDTGRPLSREDPGPPHPPLPRRPVWPSHRGGTIEG